MGAIRRLFLRGIAGVVLLRAADVSVAVHVSGSMRQYRPWQADARDLIASLLSGHCPKLRSLLLRATLPLVANTPIG
jgi:hypothetical protein